MTLPGLTEVKAYLGNSAAQYSDAFITSALAAEIAAQKKVCVVSEDNYPADLAEALHRRVARNLAMRGLPLGIQAEEMGSIRLVALDPEVRRLESSHRKRVAG